MEKAKWTFEEQWSQSLGKAEITPPAHVWVAIDGQLANVQALDYKKQAQFYQWVAAACVFLFMLGGIFYWMDNGIESRLANSDKVFNSTPTMTNNESTPIVVPDNEDERTQVAETVEAHEIAVKNDISKDISNPTLTVSLPTVGSKADEKQIQGFQSKSAQFLAVSSKPTSFLTKLRPWKADHLYGVARTWEVVESDQLEHPLWAGVSFSAGTFDPGFGSGAGDDFVLASQQGFAAESATVQNQSSSPAYSSGQSVAGGLNVGKKFSRRVILSSGLHYSAFSTGSATSQVVADVADNSYALTSETNDSQFESELASGNLRYAGEQVQLANEYEYLTIPIKAGYVLLDKKFNITLNTGLSSNILVDSKLVANGESENLSNDFSTSQRYESVYFNFLTSVEFGYVFKHHYQVLLEPNYNQALTEFTNSNHTDRAKPKNIGLAVGFRYNF